MASKIEAFFSKMSTKFRRDSTFYAFALLIILVSVSFCVYILFMQLSSASGKGGSKIDSQNGSSVTDPKQEVGISITVSQSRALSLLTGYLSDNSPVEISDIVFQKPDLVRVSGTLPLSQLSKSSSLPSKLLSDILPDAFSFKAACRIACKNGVITATPDSLSFDDVSVPVSLLPSSVTQSLNTMLNQSLSTNGYSIKNVRITDGFITVNLE